MSTLEPEQLRITWERLAQHNDWQLVHDIHGFFQQIAQEFAHLPDDTRGSRRIELAIMRAYGRVAYNRLQANDERASYELWAACYRLTLRDGWPPPEAELVAQETLARVLEKLTTLRQPASLLSWVLHICRSVRLGLHSHPQHSVAFQNEALSTVAAIDDMATAVEQQVIDLQLVQLLRAKLNNPLERLVLLRLVAFGDQPRDVARDLGLPLYRTRVAKSRALQRLRSDPEVLALLHELTGSRPGVGDTHDP